MNSVWVFIILLSIYKYVLFHCLLGRLNSIQTSVNSLLAIGVFAVYDSIHAHENYSELCHVCLVTIPYVILMLLISYVFM